MKCILSGKSCKAARFYITDYITKMSLKTYKILSLMGDALMNAHTSLLKGEQLEARIVLHKCLSQLAKQHQVHAQQAAKIVRGQCEVFCSHKTVPMMSGMLMQYVKCRWPYNRDDTDNEEVEATFHVVQINWRGMLDHHSQLEEYLNRSMELGAVSFYDFVSRFKVVQKGTKDSGVLSEYMTGERIDKMRQYPFLSDFGLFDTHEIAEHTTANKDSYMSKVVFQMVGHRLPRVHDECYKAFMLTSSLSIKTVHLL